MCRVGLCRGENCQTEPKPSGAKRSGGEGVGGGRRGLVRRACRGLFVNGACSSMGAMAGGRGSVPSRAMLGAGGVFQGAPIGGADKTGAHPKQGEHPKPKRWGFRAEAVGGAPSLTVRGGDLAARPLFVRDLSVLIPLFVGGFFPTLSVFVLCPYSARHFARCALRCAPSIVSARKCHITLACARRFARCALRCAPSSANARKYHITLADVRRCAWGSLR